MWTPPKRFRCAVLSALKHDYVARGVAVHPRFELVVVADDRQIADWGHARNQQFADVLGVPYVPDIERALADFDVDVAIVSPEAERHCDLSIRAARAGKHVVQDKPLATQRSEADRLVRTIDETGVRFLMWNRNFLPAVNETRRQIAEGVIGRPYAIHSDFYFAKDAGPRKGERLPGYPPLNWHAHQIASHIDGSDGGLGREPMGELAIEAIYPLGYIESLLGTRVERVFARSTAHFHQVYADNNVEDLASVTLEMSGGVLGSLAIGRIGAASHSSGGDINLVVHGDRGTLVVNEAHPGVGIYYRGQPAKEPRQRRVASENDFLLAQNFAEAIDSGGRTIMDARTSYDIFATCEAARESCRSGRPVNVVGATQS
ncbi:MAG: Gfo/Idh/MocA family oxidoreductase [Planctomycetaceae bacterium]|nr:Gfo/Idh/MocA family oxidoreductase [Planctomycetaceae bacterium]